MLKLLSLLFEEILEVRVLSCDYDGGRYRGRTYDLLRVKQML
jgi:hypothetical protein